MAAFSDLCDLVVQTEDFSERRERIRDSLGTDVHILADLISNLHHFLPVEDSNKMQDHSSSSTT
jgi:hypothetical protein